MRDFYSTSKESFSNASADEAQSAELADIPRTFRPPDLLGSFRRRQKSRKSHYQTDRRHPEQCQHVLILARLGEISTVSHRPVRSLSRQFCSRRRRSCPRGRASPRACGAATYPRSCPRRGSLHSAPTSRSVVEDVIMTVAFTGQLPVLQYLLADFCGLDPLDGRHQLERSQRRRGHFVGRDCKYKVKKKIRTVYLFFFFLWSA